MPNDTHACKSDVGTKPASGQSRVARFLLAQYSKTWKKYTKTWKNIPKHGKIYQNMEKYTKLPENIPNYPKIYQKATDISNIHKTYQHLTLQEPPKFTQSAIFGLKIHHNVATLGQRNAQSESDRLADVVIRVTRLGQFSPTE
jgi:hypothetical protein